MEVCVAGGEAALHGQTAAAATALVIAWGVITIVEVDAHPSTPLRMAATIAQDLTDAHAHAHHAAEAVMTGDVTTAVEVVTHVETDVALHTEGTSVRLRSQLMMSAIDAPFLCSSSLLGFVPGS
jgi:hypothetical protein